MNTWELERMRSRLYVEPKAHTATEITAQAGGPIIDMKSFPRVMFQVAAPAAITGGLTLFEIICSASSDMSSPAVVVASDAVDLDAANDNVTLECDHRQLAQLSAEASLAVGAGYRYVQARVTAADNDGPFVITAVAEPYEAKTGLTPETDIA